MSNAISILLGDLDQLQAINFSIWDVKDILICYIKGTQKGDCYEFSKIILSQPISILRLLQWTAFMLNEGIQGIRDQKKQDSYCPWTLNGVLIAQGVKSDFNKSVLSQTFFYFFNLSASGLRGDNSLSLSLFPLATSSHYQPRHAFCIITIFCLSSCSLDKGTHYSWKSKLGPVCILQVTLFPVIPKTSLCKIHRRSAILT